MTQPNDGDMSRETCTTTDRPPSGSNEVPIRATAAILKRMEAVASLR
jgi:hypothetical protein